MNQVAKTLLNVMRIEVLLAIGLVLWVFSLELRAEMPPLKRSNFELVKTGQNVDEVCPFTVEDVQKVWEGELLRARLKEKEAGGFDQGLLWFNRDPFDQQC
jgi:hypothetical protein